MPVNRQLLGLATFAIVILSLMSAYVASTMWQPEFYSYEASPSECVCAVDDPALASQLPTCTFPNSYSNSDAMETDDDDDEGTTDSITDTNPTQSEESDLSPNTSTSLEPEPNPTHPTSTDADESVDAGRCSCPEPSGSLSSNREGMGEEEDDEDEAETEAESKKDNLLNVFVPTSFPDPPKDVLEKINAHMDNRRVLIIAVVNYGMRDHLYNWIASLERVGEEHYLVFCLDNELYVHMNSAGFGDHAVMVPLEWLRKPITSEFEEYRAGMYDLITHAKSLVVQRLLYFKINVLFTDVDVIWLKPQIRQYLTAYHSMRSETHALFQQEGSADRIINSGFYLMSPSNEMKTFMAKSIALQDVEDKAPTQQQAMNIVLKGMNRDFLNSTIDFLDTLQFPNGHVYFEMDVISELHVSPFILHANYLVGSEKKIKLEEEGYWYVNSTWLAEVDKEVDQYNANLRKGKASKQANAAKKPLKSSLATNEDLVGGKKIAKEYVQQKAKNPDHSS